MKVLLILPLALSMAVRAAGEEPPVQVDAGVARREIAVGDTFRLNIDLAWKEGVNVKPLALGENVGDFAVRDITYGPTATGDGLSRRRTSLLLTVFKTGALTVPPITFVYVDENGNGGKAETPSMSIDVRSVLQDDAADIKDIKRPIEIPRRWKALILSWVLLVGLGVAAATSVLVSVKRREDMESAIRRIWIRVTGPVVRLVRRLLRRLSLIGRDEYGAPAFDAKVAEPYLTAEQAAMKEFARIEALGLPEQGRFKQYYTLVSEAVRRYLERRYKVLAMESPSSYTLAAIQQQTVTAEALGLIRSVLEETDLVKFAKFLPSGDAASALIDRGRELVRTTGRPASAETVEEVREA